MSAQHSTARQHSLGQDLTRSPPGSLHFRSAALSSLTYSLTPLDPSALLLRSPRRTSSSCTHSGPRPPHLPLLLHSSILRPPPHRCTLTNQPAASAPAPGPYQLPPPGLHLLLPPLTHTPLSPHSYLADFRSPRTTMAAPLTCSSPSSTLHAAVGCRLSNFGLQSRDLSQDLPRHTAAAHAEFSCLLPAIFLSASYPPTDQHQSSRQMPTTSDPGPRHHSQPPHVFHSLGPQKLCCTRPPT